MNPKEAAEWVANEYAGNEKTRKRAKAYLKHLHAKLEELRELVKAIEGAAIHKDYKAIQELTKRYYDLHDEDCYVYE